MSHIEKSDLGIAGVLFGICSGPELRDRVTSYLRRLYPNKPVDNVAADLGIAPDTVRKWFARENTPNGPTVVWMILYYGPEILAAITKKPPDWLDSAVQARKQAAIRAQIQALQDRLEKRP